MLEQLPQGAPPAQQLLMTCHLLFQVCFCLWAPS